VTKKAGCPERNPTKPDVIERFAEGVSNKPKYAADLAEEITPKLTDVLHNDDRIRRKCFAVRSVALPGIRHADGKVPQLPMCKRRKLKS